MTAMTNFVRTSRLYPFYLQMIYPCPATNASRHEWLERLDRDLGLLLATLRQYRVETQTVVIAGGLTPSREVREAPSALRSPTGLLRCTTNGVYEGDLRIPLLMRWPAKLKAGVTNLHPLTLPDLHATLAAWGDVSLPDEARTLSQADWLVRGNTNHLQARGYWLNPDNGAAALRDGPWKLVRPHPLAPWELYHLEKDPAERENVADRHPEELKRLQALWEKRRPAKAP
jgi:arylsulfatase A-like enzyme